MKQNFSNPTSIPIPSLKFLVATVAIRQAKRQNVCLHDRVKRGKGDNRVDRATYTKLWSEHMAYLGTTYNSVKLDPEERESERELVRKITEPLVPCGVCALSGHIGNHWRFLNTGLSQADLRVRKILQQRSGECVGRNNWKQGDPLRGYCNNPIDSREQGDMMLTKYLYPKCCPWTSAYFWTKVSLPAVFTDLLGDKELMPESRPRQFFHQESLALGKRKVSVELK